MHSTVAFTVVAQVVDAAAVVGAPAPVKALGSFLATTTFGGAVLYRYGPRVDDAVDASTASPLVSALYGVAAYVLAAFTASYLFSQLPRLGLGGAVTGVVGVAVLGLAGLSLGGAGFAVTGAWLAGIAGSDDPWPGLVAIGGVGAAAWLLLPALAALGACLAIGAVGVGGPTREWIHAGSDPREAS